MIARQKADGMARPRAFDEQTALDAATECFWREGYEATSIRELAAEMGINAPSLYNAFGDKRALFRDVLRRYVERSTRARIDRFETSLPPKQAVQSFLNDIVESSLADKHRRGCLLVNSALEIAPHDPELGAEVAAHLGEIEAFFRRSIEAAQADGAVPSGRSAADLARMLVGITLGVRVLARSNPRRDLLEGVVRPALGLLDWPEERTAVKGGYCDPTD